MEKCFKDENKDMGLCYNEHNTCYNGLDQAKMGACGSGLYDCLAKDPVRLCYDQFTACSIASGAQACEDKLYTCEELSDQYYECSMNRQDCRVEAGHACLPLERECGGSLDENKDCRKAMTHCVEDEADNFKSYDCWKTQ